MEMVSRAEGGPARPLPDFGSSRGSVVVSNGVTGSDHRRWKGMGGGSRGEA